MADHSKIEWTDASWNPVTGCTKVSDGCKHCYAERDWARLAAPRVKPNLYTGRDFTDVRCHPEKLDIPLHWEKPRRIFVNSMSDLFHESVPDSFIDKVFAVMALADHHIFQILTKRPERMLAWSRREHSRTAPVEAMAELYVDHPEMAERWPFDSERAHKLGMNPWPPSNVWLGVSCEDQATADERIPLLLQTPAAVRWASAEPLLGPISFEGVFANPWGGTDGTNALEAIDWVVAGGESGPRARPSHPVWFQSLRNQCQAAGVPFFFKQWGEWAPFTYIDENRKALLRIGYSKHEEERECVVGKHSAAINMRRLGKKAAGRTLDGRTWDEYPA
jgi:protein gp37